LTSSRIPCFSLTILKGINGSALHLGVNLAKARETVFLRGQLFVAHYVGFEKTRLILVETIGVRLSKRNEKYLL